MKSKHKHEKRKKEKTRKHKKRRSSSSSSSSSDDSSEGDWVEKSPENDRHNKKQEKLKSGALQEAVEGGTSFLDLIVSSSSSRDRSRAEKAKEEKRNENKLQEFPVGLYYPNQKQREQQEEKRRQQFQKPRDADEDYRSNRGNDQKDRYSSYDRNSRRDEDRQSSNDYRDKINDHSSKCDDERRGLKHEANRRSNSDALKLSSDRRDSKYNERKSSPSFENHSRNYKDNSDASRRSSNERESSKYYERKSSPSFEKGSRSHRDSEGKYDSHSSSSHVHSKNRESKGNYGKLNETNSYRNNQKHSRNSSSESDSSEDNSRSNYNRKDGCSKYESNSRSNKYVQRRSRNESSDSDSSQDNDQKESRHQKAGHVREGRMEASKEETMTLKDMHDELNMIAARVIKAEINGNESLVARLNVQLEKQREEFSHKLATWERDGKPNEAPKSKQVVQITEQNFKTKRKMELLEKKKLAFLGNNEDRWVSAEKTFANIGDEFDEIEEPKKKKIKPGSSAPKDASQSQLHEQKRVSRMLDTCGFCLSSSSSATQHHHKQRPILIKSFPNECYLALPGHEPLVPNQCLIITEDHWPCLTQADQNVYARVQSICESLVRVFDKQNKTCVFFEMAKNLKWNHCRVHCVPINKKKGDMAPLYFQKAIKDLELDTSQNKNLIRVEKNKLAKTVPKELDYFYVNFDWGGGFAHMIESPLSVTFAEEVIGGMLDLSASLWRQPKTLETGEKVKRRLEFLSLCEGSEFV